MRVRHKPTDRPKVFQIRILPGHLQLHCQIHAIVIGQAQALALRVVASNRPPGKDADQVVAPRSEQDASHFIAAVGKL